nr:PQQ-binding-like beta-propeller repeat protein [Sedimentibacter sp.]
MKKTAIILLFVMIFNMLPVLGATMPYTIEVSGNKVSIESQQGDDENISLVITDKDNNRVYIGQEKSKNGKALFETDLKRGDYTAYMVSETSSVKFDFKVYNDVVVDGSSVKITGVSSVGANASLVVKDEQGNRVYINQQKTDSSGQYVFDFKLETGKYKAYINTDVAGELTQTADFEVKDEEAVYDGILKPEKGSTENYYNVDVTMQMSGPVELTAPSSKVQVTVEGISMRSDRPERQDYTKEFHDVLVLDSTKTVIRLDLSREGERLDVDYSYTIKISNGAVLQNGSPIDFTNNYWDFDTKWTGKDYTTEQLGVSVALDSLYESSNFLGLYVGNKAQLERANKSAFVNLPFNWEGYPENVARVDRNGLLTAKEPGIYHLASYPGLLLTENYSNDLFLHVREPLEGKVLLQSSKTGFVSSYDKRVFSEGGYIYYREGSFIKRMDLDLKVDDTYAFNYKNNGFSMVKDIFTIEGREYLYVEDAMLGGGGYLMDIETGEIYADNLPILVKQVEKDSSLFVCSRLFMNITQMVDLSGGKIKTIASHDRIIVNEIQIGIYGNKIYMLDADGLTCYDTSGDKLFTKAVVDIKDSSLSGIFIDSQGFIYLSYPTDLGYTLSKRSGADGSEIWSKQYKSVSAGLYEDSDGGIYFNIAEIVEGSSYFVKTRLVKLDPDDGTVMREYTTGDVELLPSWGNGNFKFLGEDSRGYLYTSTVILDEDRNPIAYTDIASSSTDRGVNAIALVNDSLYREALVSTGGRKMEKLMYTADYEQVPTYIKTEENVSLYEGKELNLAATVLDQYGIPIPSVKLVYELTEGEDIITLSPSGKVTAVADIEGTAGKVSEKAEIRVYMEGRSDIASQIEVVVKQTPVASGIYAVIGEYFTLAEYEENYIESVDLVAYDLVGFHIFVADQHGDYMPDERVSSSIDDSSIAMLQQRDSENNGAHRHITVIGREKGTTSVDVWATSNDEIKITIPVSVVESNYTILWERPADGSWDAKRAYHAEGIYDDLIYVNTNKIYAVNKSDGTDIWQEPCEVAAVYGMEISYPILDSNGIIYVFDYNTLSVAAVESKDGSILWGKSYGRGIVKEFEVRDNYIYMLSDGGILYVLNKDGSLKEQMNIKGADSMDVSADEIVYVSSGNVLYRVSENKTQVLHTFEDKSIVTVKHITADKNILAEVKNGNAYSAAYVSAEGELLWENPVKKTFTASSDDNGDIYLYAFAYDKTQSYLYGFEKDGSVKFSDVEKDKIEIDRGYSSIHSQLKERPPIIKNGIVYTHGMKTIASSAEDGRTVWETYIKDQYNATSPLTLTVGDDGVIYTGTGPRGIFAYTVGEKSSSGIEIYLKGRPSLINNAMNTVSFTVKNGTLKTVENLIISADLVNSSTGETRAAALAVRDLPVNEDMPEVVERNISFNINVPAEGIWYVLLKLSSADEVYDEVKINLK